MSTFLFSSAAHAFFHCCKNQNRFNPPEPYQYALFPLPIPPKIFPLHPSSTSSFPSLSDGYAFFLKKSAQCEIYPHPAFRSFLSSLSFSNEPRYPRSSNDMFIF